MRKAAILVLLALAGCVDAPENASPSPTPVAASEEVLVDVEDPLAGPAFEAACAFGGTEQLERTDGRVRAGHAKLVFELDFAEGSGAVAGWSLDDSEITWLPGAGTHEVEVPANATEGARLRWRFWWALSTAGDECVGVTPGGDRYLVTAVP